MVAKHSHITVHWGSPHACQLLPRHAWLYRHPEGCTKAEHIVERPFLSRCFICNPSLTTLHTIRGTSGVIAEHWLGRGGETLGGRDGGVGRWAGCHVCQRRRPWGKNREERHTSAPSALLASRSRCSNSACEALDGRLQHSTTRALKSNHCWRTQMCGSDQIWQYVNEIDDSAARPCCSPRRIKALSVASQPCTR